MTESQHPERPVPPHGAPVPPVSPPGAWQPPTAAGHPLTAAGQQPKGQHSQDQAPWQMPPGAGPQPGAAQPPAAPPGWQGGAGTMPQDAMETVQEAIDEASSRIIDTSSGRADGLNKCPACGSSEVRYDIPARALVCEYCRRQWNEPNAERTFGLDSAIDQLRGDHLASATADIREDLTVMTLKCQGCGAEVVIPVAERLQARCHWCRQTLSVNTQIPNGAVPDAILPFTLTREQGIERIREFAGNRRTFALGRFKQEFVPENVLGVYIPYMVVDGNLHADLRGKGEVTTRQYTVRRKVGDRTVTETRYDADVYDVARSFDLLVDDLAVESASRYDARQNTAATNNILQAVQPCDTENAVAYNSNYLKGFNAEKRDLNITDLDDRVEDKFLAVARQKVLPTISGFDRGVQWTAEGVAVKGSRWVSIAVPVWLYSYADSAQGADGMVHYIAVNGRTGATMGSVPVSHPKIAAASCAAGLAAFLISGAMAMGYLFM